MAEDEETKKYVIPDFSDISAIDPDDESMLDLPLQWPLSPDRDPVAEEQQQGGQPPPPGPPPAPA
eukprot:7036286-Pyramimonas_sp.AAC.1